MVATNLCNNILFENETYVLAWGINIGLYLKYVSHVFSWDKFLFNWNYFSNNTCYMCMSTLSMPKNELFSK